MYLIIPSTEMSKDVVKGAVLMVVVGVCDITTGAAPMPVKELELVVEAETDK
jgi:hypothetical protein